MKPVIFIAVALLITSCGNNQKTASIPNGASTLNQNAPTPDYTPRIGVAVRTQSRTCVAIKNSNLASGTAVVLVSPMAPQAFTPATIGASSPTPCPITKETTPDVASYSVDVSNDQLPRLSPLIAVVANSNAFSLENDAVKANLDQNGKVETFRACNNPDGVHLSVWQGKPLSGTVLWRGSYYDPSMAGAGPTCSAAEVSGS